MTYIVSAVVRNNSIRLPLDELLPSGDKWNV